MIIKTAKTAGFCFGVSRAVEMASDAARDGVRCCTLGPIIHNGRVVDSLLGLGVACVGEIGEIPEGSTAVIRSHGVEKRVFEELDNKGVPYIDATCPNVSKIHRIVMDCDLSGRQVIIIGEKEHPEVRGIAGWCRDALIFGSEKELDDWIVRLGENASKPYCAVCQTTQNREMWESCIIKLKKECTNLQIFDTICNATDMRQDEARRLSEECDAMLVVGDKSSANTMRLVEICRSRCVNVFPVEGAGDFDADILSGHSIRSVGITAGASTPDWVIKEVYNKMTEEMKSQEVNPGTEETKVPQEISPEEDQAHEATFEELLEQSFKTINTGDKVKGIVTSITPTEIHVDLGAKQAGYIPLAEISDDPTAKAEDIFHIGGEVETYVLRVNDVEGTIMLSKKRLDTVKGWEDIELARESRQPLDGIVTEENKGGIVVSVKGVRVFVPASQTGLAKDAQLSSLIRTRVKLRITEVNRARRRVVGSIRDVLFDQRHDQAAKVWDEIEAGKTYSGIVKSLTSYGAFVDIGGVDGMVHISELSWNRIKNPSEVLKVGETVSVYVISFDKEKKKISLGYRLAGDNPWNKFLSNYSVGDVAHVKVVKLMPFGAFAEVMPGVDGLRLLHRIRSFDRELPVIIVSADIQESTHTVCQRLGVAGYLNKPVKAALLRTAVEQALANSRGGSPCP
jgi:4-hydroxy-3-methylbut-2-enyl diphosphate reductase